MRVERRYRADIGNRTVKAHSFYVSELFCRMTAVIFPEVKPARTKTRRAG